MNHLLLLTGVGVVAGVLSTAVGLASLVSYPALLMIGLPPVAANVTNTVGLVATGIGAVAGSRAELAGQGRFIARLCTVSALGGVAGALLLLDTSPRLFEMIVPVLIAGASILLLLGPRLRRRVAGQAVEPAAHRPPNRLGGLLAIAPIGLYGGYFGAAAGVLMLAVLTLMLAGQSLARTNAAKNVALGAANAAASVIFAVTGPVHWTAAAALAAGSLVGGWIGPALVRRVPPGPLRILIAVAGMALAVKIAIDAGLG
ncbi:sulfite exporter TauE/SafE family protein [Planosporangium flavigriseum]|uniref:Probable membrane transporter protein n=1 Tax=Planosporangium flavigriseum TaxID=373681 RepID=A0A8J3PM30_9ACTN|nr:sulfite exporter TauE/SafE family protein [Planosporangium flavigriseum]NJC66585.1 sulfite exporter TauE/SafE family protein [Planosporangium flavigriseum]GIG73458.1 UPF0721 transmembrane protein [Planosporangium flavigriseum]